MKKIFFISIITTFSLFSCVDQDFSDIDFTIFNQTDKTVKILGFERQLDPNTNGKSDVITIEANSSYTVTRITGINSDTFKVFYSVGADSVRVIFNNERVKVYTRESVRNTPDSSILDGDENHQHFITQEDYNSAIDCSGDCD